MTAPLDGVRELLRRHLGARADGIDLELTPSRDGRHRFAYSVRDGRLRVEGTDPVALATGVARYAKQEAGRSATWDDEEWIALPGVLPDRERVEFSTELVHRYYLNFVTYGYTAAYWDEERWERELDWMALHGVTMPLMALGHEAVLLETYRELGLDEESALAWIGGASHFPWTFMGGTNRWGGPVSRHWIDAHLELARKVLARQRALGMTPVLPGFFGHLPEELAPESARPIEWQGWHTPVLDPASPEFRRAASVFYAAQARLLGTTDHVAIDPFIESVPPTEDPAALTALARGLYDAAAEARPGITWVLQGWPFHYQKEYWTPERVSAFLDGIPDGHALLLDLWAEYAPVWPHSDGLWGRSWLWCMVHNFGARPALFGDLAGLRRDLAAARTDPARGDLVGFGLTMEAVENNAVVYELACDLVWEPVPALEDWLDAFARQRYRTDDSAARRAWRLLAGTLYGPGRTRSIPSPIIARPWTARAPFAAQRLAGEFVDQAAADRPSANIDAENDPAVLGDLALVAEAVRELLGVAERAAADVPDALARDVAELTGHVVAQHSRLAIRAVLAAHAAGDAARIRGAGGRLASAIDDLDELAATRPETLVGSWIGAARAWAESPADADVLERDARTLVSVWGEQTSGLHDYSGRHWSGLLRDYYRARWSAWTEWLAEAAERGTTPDETVLRSRIVAIEEAWRTSRTPYPATPAGNTLLVARRLLAALEPELGALSRPAQSQHPVTIP